MDKSHLILTIHQKHQTLHYRLNKRTHRPWAATETHTIRHGGITIIQHIIETDAKTIR